MDTRGTTLALDSGMGFVARKTLAAVVLVLAMTTAGLAQERTARPEFGDARRAESAAETSSRVLDRSFWLVTATLNTTMILDTRSTFDVANGCATCREANPFVAPFVRRGPTVTYTAGVLFDAGVMTIAAKMKGAERRWVRRTWWVMPAALIVGHSIAYRHNVNLLK